MDAAAPSSVVRLGPVREAYTTVANGATASVNQPATQPRPAVLGEGEQLVKCGAGGFLQTPRRHGGNTRL